MDIVCKYCEDFDIVNYDRGVSQWLEFEKDMSYSEARYQVLKSTLRYLQGDILPRIPAKFRDKN